MMIMVVMVEFMKSVKNLLMLCKSAATTIPKIPFKKAVKIEILCLCALQSLGNPQYAAFITMLIAPYFT